jgi:hypothetical protein
MPAPESKYLYNKAGAAVAASTVYVEVPVTDGTIGVQIAWLDAISAATITLELTNYGQLEAPAGEAGAAWEWEDSGETITGPAASAAGSLVLNLENVRQRRARLKMVLTATSKIQVLAP